MRRLVSIAAFALALSVPVWAQRGGHGGGGGGHVGGGMHGSSFAGHSGGSMGGMRSGGMRSGASFSRGFNQGSTNGSFHNHGSTNGFSHNHGFHGQQNHSHNFFLHNCFGVGCQTWGWGGAWWGWGWSDPWLWSSWSDEDRRFDEDYYRQYDMAERWNQQSLAEQRMMRQEEADGDQDAYAPRSSNPRPPSPGENASQTPEPVAATVLVFRDRHQEQVGNYAIVGQTLWSLSAQKTEKIPLSDLDIAATEKANDARGVLFSVPGVSEGQ